MFTTDNAIFLFAILLIIGVLATKFSSRLGLPIGTYISMLFTDYSLN